MKLIFERIGIGLLVFGCSKLKHIRTNTNEPTITVKGGKFVDESGREVMLNGYKVICKSKEQGYIYPRVAELFQKHRCKV